MQTRQLQRALALSLTGSELGVVEEEEEQEETNSAEDSSDESSEDGSEPEDDDDLNPNNLPELVHDEDEDLIKQNIKQKKEFPLSHRCLPGDA